MKKLLVIIWLFSFILPVFGQTNEVDNELWMGYSLKFKLSKKWKSGLKTQQRFNNNFSETKLNFVAANLGYKINKRFGFKGDFRHTWMPEERNINRYTIFFTAKHNFKKIKLKCEYRSRVLLNRAIYTGEISSSFRNKLSVQYKINKKISPYLSYEIFHEIDDENKIENHRYTAGFNWGLKKNLDLKTFLRLDQQVNRDDPDRQRIFGLMLSQSF